MKPSVNKVTTTVIKVTTTTVTETTSSVVPFKKASTGPPKKASTGPPKKASIVPSKKASTGPPKKESPLTMREFMTEFKKLWKKLPQGYLGEARDDIQREISWKISKTLNTSFEYLVIDTGYTSHLIDRVEDMEYKLSLKVLFIFDESSSKEPCIFDSDPKEVVGIWNILPKTSKGVIVFRDKTCITHKEVIDLLKEEAYCYGIDDIPALNVHLADNVRYIKYYCDRG